MKKIIYNILITTILWTFATLSATAQNDTLPQIPLYNNAASENTPDVDKTSITHVATDNSIFGNDDLRKFYNLYSAGKYHEALKLSKEMSTNNFTKAQHIIHQIYTIAAYKEMEYNAEADSMVQHFLQADPFYHPRYTDPMSFRELLTNYFTMPRFSIWLGVSNMKVNTKIDTVYVLTIDTLQRKPDYNYDAFSLQLGFEFHLKKFLSVAIAPELYNYKSSRTIKRHEFATFYYNERYMMLGLPIRIEAGLYRKREFFVPSAFVGFEPKYVLSSKYQSYVDVIGQITNIPDYQSNINVKNKINYAFFGGARLSFNRNLMTYFLEGTVSADMKNVNNNNKKYATRDILYRDLYILDSYKTSQLALTLGVKVNLKYKTVAKNGYGYIHK